MDSIWAVLQSLDEQIFIFLNGFHTPMMDLFMAWVSAHNTWIPLYLIIMFSIFLFYPKKEAVFIVLYFIASGFADLVTSGFMKPFFARLRPCFNPELEGLVHVVGNCGGKFGFASSHAANTFALFGGLYFVLKDNKIIVNSMLLWAILVSYSRIYVGVHYLSDVLFGAIIGFFISYTLYFILTKTINKK
jgi:undecaprenyl-diphosphatase